MNPDAKPILVIGGGIAGMTAAVEAAEVGYRVILVEKDPYLGGRTMRTHRYFPKMCPPTCGFEINVRRIRRSPRIDVHTLATVEEVTGAAGDFKAKIRIRPRRVAGDVAISGAVTKELTGERPDEFNLGVGTTKALYRPHAMSWPPGWMLDKEALSEDDLALLTEACPPGALDLEEEEREIEVEAGAIIVATGWRPYDATKLDNLAFGRAANVVTNVMMERLAADGGPTGGAILRPSDGKPPKRVAFVQCAGSRDENHLPYCSAVCCMASLKQVRYLREKVEDAKATVFYIDIRTIGRLEEFYYDLTDDEQVSFVKGKAAKIEEEAETQNLVVSVEDTLSGENLKETFDLVVLATGVVPNTADGVLPFTVNTDEYGFVHETTDVPGVFAAGCTAHPCDVSRTTKEGCAAALKAIQSLSGGN